MISPPCTSTCTAFYRISWNLRPISTFLNYPTFIRIAETFLDASIKTINIQGYELAFLLRGATDVLCARLAAQVRERSDIAKDLMDIESRLADLKKQLDAKEDEVSSVKQEMIACGGTIGEVAERLSASPTNLKEQGDPYGI